MQEYGEMTINSIYPVGNATGQNGFHDDPGASASDDTKT